MEPPDDVLERARAWIAGDPDEATRAELSDLVAAGDLDAVRQRVGGALEFGTAGLRGLVGAGPLRMNRAVVIRTTAGLAEHLAAHGLAGRPVVVGFDARPDSETFATDVIGVLAAAGMPIAAFPEPAPTPLVAFAVRRLDAAAGVVITASHNPPAYNGYKVYAANGAQIIPPADAEIAAAIDAVGPANEVARAPEPWSASSVTALGEELVAAYIAALDRARPAAGTDGAREGGPTAPASDGDPQAGAPTPAARPPTDAGPPPGFAYTPLHGVGWKLVRRVLAHAGHEQVVVAPEQAEPDGRFPTVAFPNPEEPGALDLAIAAAEQHDLDVVLANDPDVDRLAVAVRDADESWRLLTGNQIGVLLGAYLLERATVERTPLVVSSIVSSPMLADVAAEHRAHHEVTLTGFKWICNAALALERDRDLDFVFGYEEALGYTVGTAVYDKDGIGAAVTFADLVRDLRGSGRTVGDRLGELYGAHGLWVSVQRNVTLAGAEGQDRIDAAMAQLEGTTPRTLAGRAVGEVTDYRSGADDRPWWLGATPLVSLAVEGGRVLVRPSGTEPKLKVYADLRTELAGDDWRAAEHDLRDEADAVAADLLSFLGVG